MIPSLPNPSGSAAPHSLDHSPTIPAPICITCGYTLIGLDPSRPCPECGRAIAESLTHTSNANPFRIPAEFESSGTAPTCINCGYDLVNLNSSGPCPECGVPIVQSLQRGKLLRYAPVGWVSRLGRGLQLLHVSIAWPSLGFLLSFVFVFLAFMYASRAPVSKPAGSLLDILINIMVALTSIVLVGAGAVYIIACWFITTAPLGGLAPAPLDRFIVRWCGPALPGLVFFGDWLIPSMPFPWQLAPRLFTTALAWSFLFSLKRILEHYERRTSSWEAAIIRKYHHDRSNFVVMLLICTVPPLWVLGNWAIGSGNGTSWSIGGLGWGIGILLLFLISTIQRVRDGVWIERRVALASLADRRARTPPPADNVSP